MIHPNGDDPSTATIPAPTPSEAIQPTGNAASGRAANTLRCRRDSSNSLRELLASWVDMWQPN